MAAPVQFILGRSGSGKTHTVFSRILENEREGRRSLLIVPDRATFETERALSSFLGGGMLHASVVSFTRLALRLFAESGSRRAFLSPQGRRMLVRRVLDEVSSKLGLFTRAAALPGFAAECEHMILMCKRCSLTPDRLESAENLPAQLRNKLRDFALIYRRTEEHMADRYLDSEDLVNALVTLLPDSSVRGADVFIDAPDMLNPQTCRIIETLFSCAGSVTVTFRIPMESSADSRLFDPDRLHFERLLRTAKSLGCEAKTSFLTGDHRHRDPALAFLERNLFAYPFEKRNEPTRSIELHSSTDRTSEVREAADRIIAAVRDGLRFNEIAVAASDLSAYSGAIRRCFGQYGIPVFTDASRPVSAHPIADLVTASLDCIHGGFAGEDFIRLIKTGLTGLGEEETEKLENHVLRFGLEGKRLSGDEPSVKNHADIKDFEQLEASRLSVVRPVLELKRNMDEGGRTASARAEAVYRYLSSVGAAERIREESERLAEEPSMLAYALEARQVYDAVIELLDQVHVILGDGPIGLERFISVVREGLASYTVGSIPTTLDQVTVGDVSGMHLPPVRLLLVLGANEGMLPRVREDNAVINDRDLALMRAAGIDAWESSESMTKAEALRTYTVLFSSSESLYISYSRRQDSDAAPPSMLVSRIGEIFSHLRRTSGLADASIGGSEASALSQLAAKTRRFLDTGLETTELKPLYAHFAADDGCKDALSALEKLYFPEASPEPLGQDAAARLYGRHMTGTPTRLEVFNRCPFCYLMQFGLKLREREVREERAMDHGTLIHSALQTLLDGMIAEKTDFTAVTKEELAARLDAFLPALFEEHNHALLLDSAKMRAEAERIREELIGAAYVIVRQIASGRFEPYANELRFGLEGSTLPALELEASNGVVFRMCGIVDRIDRLSGEGGKDYFRIIDYKTGRVAFDYSELASGLRLQLPLYAAAVSAALGAERELSAAGLYYMHISELNTVTGDEERDDRELMKQMKLSGPTLGDDGLITAGDGTAFTRSSLVIAGLSFNKTEGFFKGASLVTGEEMAKTIGYAKQVGIKTLDSIMQGRAEVSPSKAGSHVACAYCPYLSICRFDTTAGSRYRRIRAVSADHFYNRKEKSK